MDIAQFRLDFPQFDDDTKYTDEMCAMWSELAESLHSREVFPEPAYTRLIELYTAHNISIQYKDIFTSMVGGIPTGDAGAMTVKDQGTVAYTFDGANAAIPNGGQYNVTDYGRQYLQLRNIYAKGCIQI